LRRGLRAVLGAERRAHLDRLGCARREQVRHGPPRPAAGAIPERQVDGGERVGEVALGGARGQQLGVAGARADVAQHRRVDLQRRRHGGPRDAVVELERRGLTEPEVVIAPGEPDAQDLALAQLSPRGRQRRA
jgi:hypothetical protein